MKPTAIRSSLIFPIAMLAIAFSTLTGVSAAAQTSAPAFNRDTMLHLLAGAMSGLLASSAASAIYGRTTVEKFPLLLPGIGLSAAITAGIAKETVDSSGFGDPQWSDIVHTLIGGVVAAGIATAVELAREPSNYQAKTAILATVGVTVALPVGVGLGQEIALFLKKEKRKR